MARTGESYQKALSGILHERRRQRWLAPAADVDLVPIVHFGRPAALATFAILGHLASMVVGTGALDGP